MDWGRGIRRNRTYWGEGWECIGRGRGGTLHGWLALDATPQESAAMPHCFLRLVAAKDLAQA